MNRAARRGLNAKSKEPKCLKSPDGRHVWEAMDKKEIKEIADDMLRKQEGPHAELTMPVEDIESCKYCAIMKLQPVKGN